MPLALQMLLAFLAGGLVTLLFGGVGFVLLVMFVWRGWDD